MDFKFNNLLFIFSILAIFILVIPIGGVNCSIRKRQAMAKLNIQKSIDLMFKNIGTYSGETKDGQFYSKQYYIPKFFRVYWHEVKGICSQYGMEFATFETKEESEKILDILRANGTNDQSSWDYYLIGGVTTVPKSLKDWFWADSGERIDYDLRWNTNEPNNAMGLEFCLSIVRAKLAYNDKPCDSYYPDSKPYNPQSFICQKKKVLCGVN